jgi:hypothetical protein
MALIAHIHNLTDQMYVLQRDVGGDFGRNTIGFSMGPKSTEQKNWNSDQNQVQVKQCVKAAWDDVLTKMNEMHSILIYANKKEGERLLGDYPKEWSEIIKERNHEISRCKQNMHRVIDKINDLEKKINERDKKIEKIREEYASDTDALQLCNSNKRGIREKLDQMLDVCVMVNNNLHQLTESFPKYENEKKSNI